MIPPLRSAGRAEDVLASGFAAFIASATRLEESYAQLQASDSVSPGRSSEFDSTVVAALEAVIVKAETSAQSATA